MSDDPVLLDVEDGVATLTLNRPGNRNALTRELGAAVVDALEELEGSGDARCLVITGAEGSFCAGGDINAMMERMTGDVSLHEAVRGIQYQTSKTLERVHDFYLPTIAKIDGVAFGAGANLAMACDLQLMSEAARISFGFRQVGLAVDTGTSYFLPRVVGLNKAKELVFTGELLDAEEALDLGLFCRVFDEFEAEADAFIRALAEGPSVALETS
ncbi:MAG: enoyl-CoA hydratase/isomerase family protein, partial [Halobacteriales archaeon]|nr:enoyl-CoA hydratase/isomerase family protein [Halobacteriales archaeon]